MKNVSQRGIAIGVVLSALLMGCGPGGGSGSPPAANQAALSADQKVFEQFALAPNASYNVDWLLPLSGTPVSGTHFLFQSHASMAASPSNAGTQQLNGTSPVSIANTLSVPSTLAVGRYLINGAIYVGSGFLNNASYQGTSIKVDNLAADGVTVVDSELRSNLSLVSLSGTVASAPTDLAQWFNALYYNSSLLSSTAVWGAGSEYLKYTSTEVADTYVVEDYTGSTTGNTPTPVATGTTIAALMAAGGIASANDGTTYTLTNGSVSSVNGVTTYVASVVIPNLTTAAYRTYYELYGNVYVGSLVKAGTVLGGNVYPVAASSSATGYTLNYSQQYQIRLNAAAVASLHAAVTF